MNRLFLLLFGMVTLVAHAQVPDYVPTEGLVAWYPFNGNANDESGNGNDGEVSGATLTTDRFDESNSSFYFDGSSYIEVANSPTINVPTGEDISWSVWLLAEPHSSQGSAFEKWDNYAGTSYSQLMLRRNAEGDDFVSAGYCANPSQAGTGLVQTLAGAGVWNHFLLVTEGLQTQLFLNGELVSTGTVEDVGCTNSNVLHIGHRAGSSGRFFKGKIDDFAIWNRALNEAEINELFSLSTPTPGCTDSAACNYNFEALSDDGSCEYGCSNCGPGTFWNDSLSLCLPSPTICNTGTYWHDETQSCMPVNSCQEDLDGDGIVGINDLLQVLSSFGIPCEPIVSEWACGDPVSYHGYDYATVQIGEQCWFAENLRTELYENGDSIPANHTDSDWEELDAQGIGGVSIYGEILTMVADYGLLYNWHAVDDSRGLCPTGWSVPSDTAFSILEVELGMSSGDAYGSYGNTRGTDQGSKMKSSPSDIPAWNGTNESGFMGLPAGHRSSNGTFSFEGYQANFWTRTAPLPTMALMRILNSSGVGQHVGRYTTPFGNGQSVRCLKY